MKVELLAMIHTTSWQEALRRKHVGRLPQTDVEPEKEPFKEDSYL